MTLEKTLNEKQEKKKMLNAIINSDIYYQPGTKALRKIYLIKMFAYAFVTLLITMTSIGLLSLSIEFAKQQMVILTTVEIIVVLVLAIDLGLRWYTADVRLKKGRKSYRIFPFMISSLILFASLFPSLYLIGVAQDINGLIKLGGFKFLRFFKLLFLANIIPGIIILKRALKKEAKVLYFTFSVILATILLFALTIFNIEHGIDATGLKPGAANYDLKSVDIKTFWDALYYSTITLTTIGFGDKTPVTNLGKVITMIMSIIGIAILAIPSGIIAGGFIVEIKSLRHHKVKEPKANLKKK